ncbi:MAG: glucose-1-phosphate thymidylyltransferase [Ignavibacteria bacterium GWF2_33_9]|nr:MAG: glucose-1-phosphate thymidylyltransferase [Ignavibacteria bacterium GWF2_33_9]
MKKTKGIVLAGGNGTRLYPATSGINKHLLQVYDKPMIYYPISTLMLSGIRDILIISSEYDLEKFSKILGNGDQFGVTFSYTVQTEPKGIAEAFIIAEEFIGEDQVCLILGDNLIYGKLNFLRDALNSNNGGYIFAYEVNNPQDFGVVTLGKDGTIIDITEKPINPQSNYAIPGIYIFDSNVVKYAKTLTPSKRNEIEITDLQKIYLSNGNLQCNIIGRGIAWLDTGTPAGLLDAGLFIHTIENRQGRKIACLEEIAVNNEYISIDFFREITEKLPDCKYKNYLLSIIKSKFD